MRFCRIPTAAGEVDSLTGNLYSLLGGTQVDLGKWDDARATLQLGARRLPDHPRILWTHAMLEASHGNLKAGAARAQGLLARHGEVPYCADKHSSSSRKSPPPGGPTRASAILASP